MGTHPIFESDFDCLTEKMDYNNEWTEESYAEHKRVDRFYDWYTEFDGTMKFYDCKFVIHLNLSLKSFTIDPILIEEYKSRIGDCTVFCADGKITAHQCIINAQSKVMRQSVANGQLLSSFSSATMKQVIGRMYNQRVSFSSILELIEITLVVSHYQLVAITSFVEAKWDAICATFGNKQKASNLCRDFLLILGFDEESKLVAKVSNKMQRLARPPWRVRPNQVVTDDGSLIMKYCSNEEVTSRLARIETLLDAAPSLPSIGHELSLYGGRFDMSAAEMINFKYPNGTEMDDGVVEAMVKAMNKDFFEGKKQRNNSRLVSEKRKIMPLQRQREEREKERQEAEEKRIEKASRLYWIEPKSIDSENPQHSSLWRHEPETQEKKPEHLMKDCLKLTKRLKHIPVETPIDGDFNEVVEIKAVVVDGMRDPVKLSLRLFELFYQLQKKQKPLEEHLVNLSRFKAAVDKMAELIHPLTVEPLIQHRVQLLSCGVSTAIYRAQNHPTPPPTFLKPNGRRRQFINCTRDSLTEEYAAYVEFDMTSPYSVWIERVHIKMFQLWY